MCQSSIKQITKINKGVAYVDKEQIQLLFDGARAGDFILVYGSLAMRKVDKSEAKEILKYGA